MRLLKSMHLIINRCMCALINQTLRYKPKRSTETPEARKAHLQQDAASHQSIRSLQLLLACPKHVLHTPSYNNMGPVVYVHCSLAFLPTYSFGVHILHSIER